MFDKFTSCFCVFGCFLSETSHNFTDSTKMGIKHFEVVKQRSHADKQWFLNEIKVWHSRWAHHFNALSENCLRWALKPLFLKLIGHAKRAMRELSPIQFGLNWAERVSNSLTASCLLAKRSIPALNPIWFGQFIGLIELSTTSSPWAQFFAAWIALSDQPLAKRMHPSIYRMH